MLLVSALRRLLEKKVLYNLLYKLLQLVLMCREIPLFQKTCWTNCSKGTHSKYTSLWGRNRRGFTEQTVHAIHPSIPWDQQYTLHEKVHSSISNTEKTKYSHLDLKTLMIMWRPWYWDSEAEDKSIPAQLEKGLRKHFAIQSYQITV